MINKIASIALGVIVGGLALWGIYYISQIGAVTSANRTDIINIVNYINKNQKPMPEQAQNDKQNGE